MGTEFVIAVGVFPGELLSYQVSIVCALAKIALHVYIYLI